MCVGSLYRLRETQSQRSTKEKTLLHKPVDLNGNKWSLLIKGVNNRSCDHYDKDYLFLRKPSHMIQSKRPSVKTMFCEVTNDWWGDEINRWIIIWSCNNCSWQKNTTECQNHVKWSEICDVVLKITGHRPCDSVWRWHIADKSVPLYVLKDLHLFISERLLILRLQE